MKFSPIQLEIVWQKNSEAKMHVGDLIWKLSLSSSWSLFTMKLMLTKPLKWERGDSVTVEGWKQADTAHTLQLEGYNILILLPKVFSHYEQNVWNDSWKRVL